MTLNRKTGTLEWISGTGFAAGFKGFEPFHGKLVPRLIETFPWIAHGDVNTKIVELDDLNAPDEALFAVSNPTPPESQLRFVELTEVEYRKLAIDPPVMKWPAVKVRPTTGNLVTRIVTDRSGQVRDYSFVVSHNMSIAEGVEPLIRQWRFKPFLVDGVPVEVLTTLTFAFDMVCQGTVAAGAKLEIETVPAACWCAACQAEFECEDFLSDCPRCNQPSANLRRGRELELTSVETS